MYSSKFSTSIKKRAASPTNGSKSSKQRSDNEAPNFEVVLRDELISLRKIILRHSANAMIHGKEDIEMYLDDAAKEFVMKEVSDAARKLKHFKGNVNSTGIITGYIQAARKINQDLEKLVFTDERKQMNHLKQSTASQECNSRIERDALSSELAIKEQTIKALATETTELLKKCEELSQKNEYLTKELEKSKTDQMEKHQCLVELRMQGIDFKSEVNRRSLKVLNSVQTRMGFVPSGVQKQILLLNVLKAPGDPAYDDVRCNGYSTPSEKASATLEAELSSLVPPMHRNDNSTFSPNCSSMKLPIRPPSINCTEGSIPSDCESI